MRTTASMLLLVVSSTAFAAQPLSNDQPILSLDAAVKEALSVDNWLSSNQLQEQALRANAIAVEQLPDPKLRMALANLPLDSLDFNQENMTQMQLGVSQQFPRGDSLKIKRQQIESIADKAPIQRQDRAAKIKRNVSQSWLALHQTQEQLGLLNRKRHIFQELVSISRANFRTGKVRRFEVLDSELQVTRLKERIVRLEKRKAQQQAQLSQWLPIDSAIKLPGKYKPVALLTRSDTAAEIQALTIHPQMVMLDQELKVKAKGVELADEAYKPGFKVDASYGYRDDMPSGIDRSDFFSVAVTMDLPLFTDKRQDQRRKSAVKQREATVEKRLLKARELKSQLRAVQAELEGLNLQLEIYNTRYLSQLASKRKAVLSAYASADARFNEVAIASIAELEAQLRKITLEHQRQMTMVRINYFFAGVDPQLSEELTLNLSAEVGQ